MIDNDFVITLSGVTKKYKLFNSKQERMKEALHPFKKKYHKDFYALNGIDLQIRKGEVLGIVGMNGSGKSTLLKIVAGIIPPSTGEVTVSGNIVPLLELGAGFNPEFSGLENIYFYNSIMGYSRKQTDAILDKILDFAEIGEFIHQPIKTYSSGMKARLSFAVSVNINPDILIIDEVLSVGDELFQRKSFAKIEEFFKAEKTILFVSHSEGNINQLCSRAIMLNQGKIVLEGIPKLVTMNYTKFLFSDQQKRTALLQDFQSIVKKENILQNINYYQEKSEKIEVFSNQPQIFNEEAFFIPNFNPKSTTIICNANLSVTEIHIEKLSGEEVNALVQHDEYVFSYQVTFLEDIGCVNYGIGFKTEKGVPLSWRVFPAKMNYLKHEVKSGDVITVKWKFTCLYMPGTYFINTGIRKNINGEEFLLFKGSDIFVFKVIGGDMMEKGGLFDTNISCTVQNE